MCDFESGPSTCDFHQDDADEEEWQRISARLYAADGGCDHTTLTGERVRNCRASTHCKIRLIGSSCVMAVFTWGSSAPPTHYCLPSPAQFMCLVPQIREVTDSGFTHKIWNGSVYAMIMIQIKDELQFSMAQSIGKCTLQHAHCSSGVIFWQKMSLDDVNRWYL